MVKLLHRKKAQEGQLQHQRRPRYQHDPQKADHETTIQQIKRYTNKILYSLLPNRMVDIMDHLNKLVAYTLINKRSDNFSTILEAI